MSRKKELKTSIKEEIQKMLGEEAEPSEGRMKLLKLCITYLAVEAKLEETEYGNWFSESGDTEPSGPSAEPKKGKKPGTRRNEGDDADSGFFTGSEGSLPS